MVFMIYIMFITWYHVYHVVGRLMYRINLLLPKNFDLNDQKIVIQSF